MKGKRKGRREEKREREGEVENHENKSQIFFFFLMKKGKCSNKVRSAKLQMGEKGIK